MPADDAFGMSPSFREGLAALGDALRAGRSRPAPRSGRWSQSGPVRSIRGFGRPRKPRLRGRAAAHHGGSAVMNCRRRPGVRLRWPREARDHAAAFSAPRGCGRPAGGSPAKSTGPSTAGTWTAANPATTCPMLRRIPRWRGGGQGLAFWYCGAGLSSFAWFPWRRPLVFSGVDPFDFRVNLGRSLLTAPLLYSMQSRLSPTVDGDRIDDAARQPGIYPPHLGGLCRGILSASSTALPYASSASSIASV